jgi:chemotaxis protein MotA
MDLATVAGLAIAIISCILTVILEGGNPLSLVNLPAAVVVFGGTLGATMASFSMSHATKFVQWFMIAMKEDKKDARETITTIVQLAETARREGILKLESAIDEIEDDFLRQGITLVVDGTDYEVTKTILYTEIDLMKERHQAGAKFFQTAGGFGPTLGIIGTVMGLVNVLSHLEEASNLGHSIATAFIATFYGVASANLIWLPISNKLKLRSAEESLTRDIIAEGILAIQAGESPRIIGDRLTSFLPPSERAKEEEKAAA